MHRPTWDLKAAQWLFVAALPVHSRSQYPFLSICREYYLSTETCPVSFLVLGACTIAAGSDRFQGEDAKFVGSGTDRFLSLPISVVPVHANAFRGPAKLAIYHRQFRNEAVHIIGCEESRRRIPSITVEDGYIMAD